MTIERSQPILQEFHSSCVSRKVFNFYDHFNDDTIPIFDRTPVLAPTWDDLSARIKLSVIYAAGQPLTAGQSEEYFRHVNERDKIDNIPSTDQTLESVFGTPKRFHKDTVNYNKLKVVEEGWVRGRIKLEGAVNSTGCFRCPMNLLEKCIRDAGGTDNLIPFSETHDTDGRRTYSSPWDTDIYGRYFTSLSSGRLVLVDMFSDGATLSSSGTQSAMFIRTRFPTVKKISEKWFDVAIAPTSINYQEYLSTDKKRMLKLEVSQRYLFLVFKKMIEASQNGKIIQGAILYPRIAMTIMDQPEERSTLFLKDKNSFMDCTHCVLPSRTRVLNTNEAMQSSTGELSNVRQQVRVRRTQTSQKNRAAQLDRTEHESRPVAETLSCQLETATNQRILNNQLQSKTLPESETFLNMNSCHAFPPSLSAFDGPGSPPYMLYSTVTFDKLHVMDLGIIRLFCDEVCDVLERKTNFGLSRIISILNERYSDIPRSARLSYL